MGADRDLILIDKPRGISSYDVIRRLERLYPREKLGHAGTLDPLATGLLIVGVGKATKGLERLLGLPKTYEAEVLLGIKTDTGDLEGEVTEEKEVSTVDEKKVKEVLKALTGTLKLPVPLYSSLKMKGRPLYWYARNKIPVTPPQRLMLIHSLALNEMRPENGRVILEISAHVGSGTYVRSLAEEIGERLGVPATLASLCRTKIGDYDIKDATTLESLGV